jgi:short-subunit dehydrogenase
VNPLQRAARQAAKRMNSLAMRPLRPGPRSGSLEKAVRDKVMLITGASSGIGEQAARQIGAAGGTLLLVARSAEKLEALAAEVNEGEGEGSAQSYPCDLNDYEAIDALTARVLDEHGRVDVLVNNAGRSIRRAIEHSYDRFHDFERTMQLNYFAPVRLILAFLPGMRERKSGQVINISTMGVQTRVPRFGAYIASKSALDALSDSIQAEVANQGVRLTTIHMPLVRTPMIAPTGIYKRFPALTAEQAAEMITDAVVRRPRRIVPPFGHAAAFADAVTPRMMDTVRNRGFRMFRESGAARGDEKGAEAEEQDIGAAESAFARATRGTHW